MAKNLSAERAVRVKMETAMDISLTVSDSLQMSWPHGHESTVYTMDVKGTLVIITNKSANASDNMYLEKRRRFYRKEFQLKLCLSEGGTLIEPIYMKISKAI